MINITLWDAAIGEISDTDTADLAVGAHENPGMLVAEGLSTGESIEISVQATSGGRYAALMEGGSQKALTPDDNTYLIESAGNYRLTFQGNSNAANAAAVQVGYSGG